MRVLRSKPVKKLIKQRGKISKKIPPNGGSHLTLPADDVKNTLIMLDDSITDQEIPALILSKNFGLSVKRTRFPSPHEKFFHYAFR